MNAQTWKIDEARTTDLLRTLVRTDSINPGLVPGAAGEGKIARWLAEMCETLGLETRRVAPT